MTYLKRPWQKGYRKLPNSVLAKMQEIEDAAIKVASVRDVPKSQIHEGLFCPIGIYFDTDGNLHVPNHGAIPDAESGLWARRNADGWVLIRKDLPKIPRVFSVEVPNFGDYSRGTHEMSHTRECYQREVIGPLEIPITAVVVETDDEADVIRIAFEENYLFDPNDADFERQLLLGLSLLQEATGCSDVFPVEVDMQEIARQRTVAWELLPPGISEKEIEGHFPRSASSQNRELLYERIRVLKSMNPECFVCGRNMGTNAYFGAKYSDDLVVFENLRSGNAIYIMFEDWEELSKLSRTELLRNPGNYERVIHREGWERKLRRFVNLYSG